MPSVTGIHHQSSFSNHISQIMNGPEIWVNLISHPQVNDKDGKKGMKNINLGN